MATADFLTQLFGLEDQTAVVIGGAGELGFALSKGLAQAGAHVVVADMNLEACQKRVAQIEEFGGKATAVDVDVTTRTSLDALLAEALKVSGRVDMLVNCAGINAGNPFLEVDPDLWDKIFAVNLKGMMEACQVFHRCHAGGRWRVDPQHR